MENIVTRSDRLYNVLLRGFNTYEDFIGYLRNCNQLDNYEDFKKYFASEVYVEDDYNAIIYIIEEESSLFDNLSIPTVFDLICREIYSDIINK